MFIGLIKVVNYLEVETLQKQLENLVKLRDRWYQTADAATVIFVFLLFGDFCGRTEIPLRRTFPFRKFSQV